MMLLVSGSTRSVGKLAGKWPERLGHLLTPNNRNGMAAILKTGLLWAADNGAFSGFNPVGFRRFLRKISGQPGCLFVACPDAVGDAERTIDLFGIWKAEVAATGQPVAFVLQDGQENRELPPADAYFVGGSTEWKLSNAARSLCHEAKRREAWLHMGRVNSDRRIRVAYEFGCDSIDGSSASMFGDKYIGKYLRWIQRVEWRPLFSR